MILFTDLVGSTSLNVTAGDYVYLQLLRAHDRVVRDGLRRHGGVEFKHTGDGVAAWFRSARQAVASALDLQDTLAGALHAESGVEVRVRCGWLRASPSNRAAICSAWRWPARRAFVRWLTAVRCSCPTRSRRWPSGPGCDSTDRGAVELRGIPGEIHVMSAHADGD